MGDLRKLAHLQEQIGKERWQALINSDNTRKVSVFCDELLGGLPNRLASGDRIYQICNFFNYGEDSVPKDIGIDRAIKLKANLGEGDARYLLEHQADIPSRLRNEVFFTFTNWGHHSRDSSLAVINWSDREVAWELWWPHVDSFWTSMFKVLHREDKK